MSNTFKQKKLSVYLISDASGETVESIAHAIKSQFDDQVEMTEYLYPLVRSKQMIDEIFEVISPKSDTVLLYTIVDFETRKYLEKKAKEHGVLAVFALEHIINSLANFMEIKVRDTGSPGKHKRLDANYYQRIETLNFAMHHDDGSDFSDADEADILILGVSRTSKSPTSLYLAQRGYKVANLPIVYGIDIDLSHIKSPVMIGFTISKEILYQIRANRLTSYSMHLDGRNNDYAEIDKIKIELEYALHIFRGNEIPIIDVSRRAIEEVAAEIINIYTLKKGRHKMLL